MICRILVTGQCNNCMYVVLLSRVTTVMSSANNCNLCKLADVAGRRSAEAPPPVIMPLQYQGSLASEIARMESLELARMQSVSTLIKQQSDASSSNQSALLPANTANHVSANRRGSLVLLAENTKAAARQSIFTAVAAVKEATLTAASSQIGMVRYPSTTLSALFKKNPAYLCRYEPILLGIRGILDL